MIDHDDDITVCREKFRIPTIAPVIAPGPLRSAVDEKFDWIFFIGIKVRRFDEEAFYFDVLRAGEPERFTRRHRGVGKNGVIQMGNGSQTHTSGAALYTGILDWLTLYLVRMQQ